MQEATSSLKQQSVATASRFRTAAYLEASRSAAIRHAVPCSAAAAILSSTAHLTRRIRALSSSCGNHKQLSPHNKRLEFARTARPTRKSEALLLAAHSRR
jgi:hypothetical protein